MKDNVVIVLVSQGPSLEEEAAARADEERVMRGVRSRIGALVGMHTVSC